MPSLNELPPPPGLGPAFAPPPAQAPPPPGPDVGSIIMRMLAHLPVTLVVLGFGLAITMVMARSRKPAWNSETVVYYREGINRQFVGVENEGNALKTLPARLKETLLSRAHLEKIVKEFNLYPLIVDAEGYIAAVDKFRVKITFKPRSEETFLIAFEGSTAEEAQQVTARLADVLVENMHEQKRAQARTTTDFLEAEKKRAEEDLTKRETELARFIALHPEFAAEGNAELAGAGVRTEKAKAIADPELLALDRQQQRIRAALEGKAAGGAPGVPGGAAGPDPALVAAKNAADAEAAAAERDFAQKSEKLTDNHPDVKMAKSRLAAAQGKAREAACALAAGTPAPVSPFAAAPKVQDDPYDTKNDEKKLLQSELAKNERELQMRKRGLKPDTTAQSAANQIIELETEWKQLNREREKARAREGDIGARLFRAQANAASELGGYNSQVMVLDPAYRPVEPNTMPKWKFIAIGVLASIIVGLAAAAGWGMMLDDRVFVSGDLAGFAPVLASVPKAPPAKKGKRRA